MITYQVDDFVANRKELEPLFQLHWEEVARHKDTIKLDVDWDTYGVLEDAGILNTITCRDDSKLIGYIVFVVTPNLHYRQVVEAQDDILFMHPDYRGRGCFIKMLQFAEEFLVEIGAHALYINMKTAHDFSPILIRQGYQVMEKKFEKQLAEVPHG